ncbi:MAG: cytochrome c biogenesis CcdA family protein [Lentilitoribacter sp.]
MEIAEISVLTAILAGAISFLSPCVLPLVPPYLCYMAGVSMDDFRQLSSDDEPNESVTTDSSFRKTIMLTSLLFTLGFATVFIALGASASTLGGLMRQHIDVLAQIGGVIIIIMGLHFLGVFKIGLLAREMRFQGSGKPATYSGAYLMGLAFAFGWTPCIGPVLGAILGVAASTQTAGSGALLLGAYSLGLAVPFWIAASFSGKFMNFLTKFRRHLGLVEKLMGLLLVLTGILFLTGAIATVGFWLLETFPILGTIG